MNKSVEPSPSHFSTAHLNHWDTHQNPIVEVKVDDQTIDELYRAASRSTDDSFYKITNESFSNCLTLAGEIRARLAVSGAVIVDRLPVEANDLAVNRRAAGILSNLIEPLMTQDIKGTLLYDVIDEGAKATGTIRRSKTNEEQPFHTDGPWHLTPPSMIGLFCIKPAAQGGYSQVSSLQRSLDRLLNEKPHAIEILEQMLMWNRMGQYKEGENAFNSLSIIQQAQNQTLIRHYVDYVKTGHELAGSDLPDDVVVLLHELEASLALNACKPFKLEAGQFQFVNNWTVAHARAGFDDPDADLEMQSETPSGRHLLRLWGNISSSE